MKSAFKNATTFILALLCFAQMSFATVVDHHHEDHTHLPVGGRRALHGMVVFGAGPYFLEHIPMLTPPHDFQIIAEVILTGKNGKTLDHDFSHQGFTLKPSSNFSLNDYVAGRLKTFTGGIYQGSFEQNGRLMQDLEDVGVEVVRYQVIRQLPGVAAGDRVISLGTGINVFESNVISPAQQQQRIRNATTGEVLWCVKAPDFFDGCD